MPTLRKLYNRGSRFTAALAFTAALFASAMVGFFGAVPVAASTSASFVDRVQFNFAEGTDPTVTMSSGAVEDNLLIVSAFSRSGDLSDNLTISGSGWVKQVARDTLPTDTAFRRSLTVWTKSADANEPSAITVTGGSGSVKLLVQEFSSAAPGEFTLLEAASNDNGNTSDATSLSTGTTSSNNAEQLWVSVLGVRNNRNVNIAPATWTAPVANQAHSNGGGFGRTLSSGYGVGSGNLAAEATASWSGSNSGASAAILAFQAPAMCYLTPQSGRTIVDFTPYGILRSDRTQAESVSSPFTANIPAGTYNITLHSWDNHSGSTVGTQANESWFLQLSNSTATDFQVTSSISDLPDDQDFITEVVDSELEITQDIETVVAAHAFFGANSSPNSIYPICVAFDEVDDDDDDDDDDSGQVLSSTTGQVAAAQVVAPSGSVDAGTPTTNNPLTLTGLVASVATFAYGVKRFIRQ